MRYAEITPRVLERAYWTYRTVGFVQNQVEFSTRILGRRPAYYSCMVSRGRMSAHAGYHRASARAIG